MGFLGDAKRGAGERVGHRVTDTGLGCLGWVGKKVAIGTVSLVAVFGSVTFVQTLSSDQKGPSFGALYWDQTKENVRSLWDMVGGEDNNAPAPK